jgi:rod shape determining protein RodA
MPLQIRFGWFKRLDFTLLILSTVLLLAGCLFIYGTGQQSGGGFAHYWLRQLAWLGLGGLCFVAICTIGHDWLGRYCWVFYGGGLLLLVLVLIFGREVHGARSWLPIMGMTLQPSEVMKPATVLAFAWVASRPGIRLSRSQSLIPLALVGGVPVLLVALQPDWGSALVYIPMCLAILFVGGLPWKWWLGALVAVMLFMPIGYRFCLAPHQQKRIQTFLRPSEDVSDAGGNAHQSLLAVGSGGGWGKGFMQGTQPVRGF